MNWRNLSLFIIATTIGVFIPIVAASAAPLDILRDMSWRQRVSKAVPTNVRTVESHRVYEPGTIVIRTRLRRLYYYLEGGEVIRYPVGVGRDGFRWSGVTSVEAKKVNPSWTPPTAMLKRQPYLPRHMAGGPNNPLGVRAMYLKGTLYRIHGTNEPESIGHFVSSGCIRMHNADVIDLYNRVAIGAKVVVLP